VNRSRETTMHSDVRTYLDAYKLTGATREFVSKRQVMFIDGKWVDDTADSIDVIEPSTERLLTRIPAGTAMHVDRAVSAARREFEGGSWSKLRPLERDRLITRLADLLEANGQELAELESINVGKSVGIALAADVASSVDTLRYFAGWAGKIDGRHAAPVALPGARVAFTRKEPVGVVGCIIPWNFPLNTLSWKLGAALVTGCTVVIKPSELTSFTALRLAELAQQAGVPDGVVNVVTGTGDVAGAALAAHRGINKVTFTGSTRTGQRVARAAAENISRVTLELGGKSPVIVLADADLAKAVPAIADGIFFNSGQACDAGSRAYVHESIYERFLKQLAEQASSLPIAPGLDPNCFIGPLVSERQLTTVLRYIESGKRAGARLVCGGERLPRRGYFVPPTVFADCTNEMQIVREEIFGPVLTVAPFTTLSEAVQLANDTDYGLAAAIYSNDLSAVHTLIPQLRSGTIYVNQHATLDPALPFGGYKQSGYGKDMGPEQLESFLETKAVWITLL
jgi:phenylacetaldehyde dehydrogenase